MLFLLLHRLRCEERWLWSLLLNANFVFHSSLGKAEEMFLFCWDFSAVKLLGNVLAVIVLGKHERDYKLLPKKVEDWMANGQISQWKFMRTEVPCQETVAKFKMLGNLVVKFICHVAPKFLSVFMCRSTGTATITKKSLCGIMKDEKLL